MGMTEVAMAYDTNNIFAKILRGEIPCRKAHEDEHVLAFHDIHPKAPVHILVLPKGAYADMDDFTKNAAPEEIAALFRALGQIARDNGLDETGYRVISNCGVNGGQEVPHLHLHLLGGKRLGKMVEAA
jgi:diadenosine tetraphosphate (Ap4A) HIT family hydrolase